MTSMRGYQGKQKALLPWQDMFVDLVQGRLQALFLSLLAGELLLRLRSLHSEMAVWHMLQELL